MRCQKCGKEFTIPYPISQKRIKDRKFCSRSCANSIIGRKRWEGHREKRICLLCHKEFETTLSDPRRYCSRACANQSPIRKAVFVERNRKPAPKGKENINFRFLKTFRSWGFYTNRAKWKEIRLLTLQRDNFRCRRCGREITVENAQVHHIIPFGISRDNSLDNLLSLCDRCHISLEKLLTAVINSLLKRIVLTTKTFLGHFV